MLNAHIEKLCIDRKPVKVFTTNGFQMSGIIIEHDTNVIALLCDNVKKLVFIHAISTIELVQNNEFKA